MAKLLLFYPRAVWCHKLDISFDFYFSASDAIKGEGLQEGVDWLQGTPHAAVHL